MASQLVVVRLWMAHDVGACNISSIIKSATENLQGVGIHHRLFGTFQGCPFCGGGGEYKFFINSGW